MRRVKGLFITHFLSEWYCVESFEFKVLMLNLGFTTGIVNGHDAAAN